MLVVETIGPSTSATGTTTCSAGESGTTSEGLPKVRNPLRSSREAILMWAYASDHPSVGNAAHINLEIEALHRRARMAGDPNKWMELPERRSRAGQVRSGLSAGPHTKYPFSLPRSVPQFAFRSSRRWLAHRRRRPRTPRNRCSAASNHTFKAQKKRAKARICRGTAGFVKGFRMPASHCARGCTEAGVRKASKEETAGGVCACGSVGLWGFKARFCATWPLSDGTAGLNG